MDTLGLIDEVLSRTDLSRQERVVFADMRAQVALHGVVLSEGQKGWLRSVKDRPVQVVTDMLAPKPTKRVRDARDTVVFIAVALVAVETTLLGIWWLFRGHG